MSIPDPIVLLDARARYVHPAFEMSRASTKTVFDSAGRLVTVPPNAIGWDHDPATGQARGYLAEPSGTNLLRNSNKLDMWVQNGAAASPAAIGPNEAGIWRLTEDASGGAHRVQNNSFQVEPGGTITLSCIARADERHRLQMQFGSEFSLTENVSCVIDLLTGGVDTLNSTEQSAAVDAGADPLHGGFFRCWLAGSLPSNVTVCSARLALNAETSGYVGDGESGLYAGCAQAESGYRPSSYIDTGDATAARTGDWLRLSRDGWRQGTLVIDCTATIEAAFGRLFDLDGVIYIRRATSFGGSYLLGGSLLPSGAILSGTAYQRHVIAVSWDKVGVAAAVDGQVMHAAESQEQMPDVLTLGLGSRAPGGQPYSGQIRRAVYYPTPLSNADLQSLTAIQE